MSTEITVYEPHGGMLTPAQVVGHVARVQEVMGAVMKANVHYGKIPGTDKPTLYKPGAEVLCATFRIAPKYRIEDLSTHDSVRYRVTCVGVHQLSGIELGEGIGECSSMEEKYKWRKAASINEYEATMPDRRRVKHGYSKQDRKSYEIRQVRTEPADVANTILKMAAKRAQVAMTLNVTAASDMFSQDLEDLPPELREEFMDIERGESPPPKVDMPTSKSATPDPKPERKTPPPSNGNSGEDRPATDGERANIRLKLSAAEITEEEFTHHTGLTVDALTLHGFRDAKRFLANPADYVKPEAASADV